MFRCLALCLSCCTAALAQPLPELVTDRPDFTESGVVVPLGHVQVEGGVTRLNDTPTDSFSEPELLVRWTPLPRFELRLGAPDYVAAERVGGFGDPSLGVKVQLGPLARWDLGVIASASFPLGDAAFSSDTMDPELIVATSYARSERLAYGGQVTVGRGGSADGWYVGGTLVQSMTFGEDAFLFNERWGAFFEFAATVPEHGKTEALTHVGGTYALSPNAQLDFHIGTGLTAAAPTTLFGVGFSIRR